MEDFKQRLLEFIGHLGISPRSFEEGCGLSQGIIKSIKVKGPSVDVLQKIAARYPDLNIHWLVTGEGQMLISRKPAPSGNKVEIANLPELKEVIVDAIREALI